MEFELELKAAARGRTDCAVIGVYEGAELDAGGAAFDRRLGGCLGRVLRQGDLAGKIGETLLLPDLGRGPAARALLVGLGSRKDWGQRNYRRALLAGAQALV